MSHPGTCNFSSPSAFQLCRDSVADGKVKAPTKATAVLEGFRIRSRLSTRLEPRGFNVRYLRYVALLAMLMLPLAYSQAQVSVGVEIGVDPANYDPGYVDGPPVCPYGYYSYYPYACAPYGFYGPHWFAGGVFIGAGPWYHWGHGGHWDRSEYWGHGYGREGWGYARGREYARGGYGRGYVGGYARGSYGRGYSGNYGRGGYGHGYAGSHGGGHR
jgi:hypothetical protein